MTQTVLNDCQACWLIQLAFYDFIIHYCKSFLNSVNRLSCQSDYLVMKQKVKESSVGKLMFLLVNKLAITAVSEAGEQCQIRESDFYAESLIEVLSLQVITQSVIRFAADNLRSENLVELIFQKSMSSSSLMNKKKLHVVTFKKKSILELI